MTELTADVRTLFDGPNYAHIATTMPDGGPHSVPLWVGIEGDRIAFLTAPSSRKARNLDNDPRVAISITAHDQPFSMALVRGRVVERLEGEDLQQQQVEGTEDEVVWFAHIGFREESMAISPR